ncbi:MAG: DUF1461 domain-containing protein [Eubacteriales bacterium]|nr:DUF1461 domain-containing protein [Eubacteriales bacterium]
MSISYRILFFIIAISIPAVTILSAFNIVFRLPDLYVYEFNRIQVADEIDLGIPDDELGRFFSDFMKGQEEEFDLFTEYRDREQSVFGTVEQANMEHARMLLNYSLYILGVGILFLLLTYCIFLVKKKKHELRVSFKGGILVFTVLLVLLFAAFYFDQTRTFLYELIFINSFGADDVLPLMLTERFGQISMVAIAAVGLVILVILASVTWRITKPRRMFW